MAGKQAIGGDAKAAFGLAVLLTLLALLINDGTVGLLLGAVSVGLVVYTVTRIPLRHSMMGLMFLALALPNQGEGQPTEWPPPFNMVGAVLLNHMNTVDRDGLLGSVPFSVLELLFLVLGIVHFNRRSTRSKIDGDVIPTPRPLIRLAHLALAVSVFTWITGLVRGGDFGKSLWQMNAVIYLPIAFLLFQAGFRGPQDLWTLARVYLAAAIYKCGLAVYVVSTISVPMNPETGSTRPAYATAHADSMLFAGAFVLVIGMWIEQVNRRVKWLVAAVLPILIAGTVANNRRLAWVQLGVVLFMLFLVSRETRLKRAIRRAVVVAVPLALGYVVAGWNSQFGTLFRPVRMIRSVVDAESDGSSQWRELENVNLIATFRENPIFGTGYGHPFKEVVVLPAVVYDLEHYIPHNSFLGLWGYSGYVGFMGLTMLWVAGVYFAMRAYHAAQDPGLRTAALVSFGAVPIYMAQCWGDLGLSTWTGVFMMAASLTVAGKLAVATGQWSDSRRKPAPAAAKPAPAAAQPRA